MTINRGLKTYNRYVLANGVDQYYQTNTSRIADGTIKAYIVPFTETLVSNPKYNEVKLVGVTKDSLSLDSFIVVNNIYYQVVEFTPTPRYNRFLLRECS